MDILFLFLVVFWEKGGEIMKKFGVLLCLLLGLTACGQSTDVETTDDPQPQYFETVEEGIAFYKEDEEEILYQERIYSTEIVLLYSAENTYFSALAFAEQPEGYIEQWGLAGYGSAVTLSCDAPWERTDVHQAAYPYYEIDFDLFEEEPTAEMLEERGFDEYMERDGKYIAVKLTRYEMQPVATHEVSVKEK